MFIVLFYLYICDMNTTYIYGLKDPVSLEMRYVGKSNNPIKRLKHHIYNSKKYNRHCSSWIKSLLNNNLFPILEIIEECTLENWQEREIHWIGKFDNLVNHTKGGQGRTSDGKSTIKNNSGLSIEELIPAIISMIPTFSDREIERKFQLSKGFISRCRNGYIKYITDNSIIIPKNKTRGNGGFNKGKKFVNVQKKKHPSIGAYNRGCRCQECIRLKSESRKKQELKKYST